MSRRTPIASLERRPGAWIRSLRTIWAPLDFASPESARHARDAIRHEVREGIFTLGIYTLLLMGALSCLYYALDFSNEYLYTFGVLGALAVHVAVSAKTLPENADTKVLYLLGMVLLSMSALAFVLLAQRHGNFSAATLTTVLLLFMVVPLVPWGMREALIAIATIYVIFTGSTLSAGTRFPSPVLWTLQFMMISAAAITLGLVARTVVVRRGHLKARIDLSAANEKLLQISLSDPLTGAWNRRYLEQQFAHDGFAAKCPAGFWFCVLDIDRFKALNDTYGHACGDRVLQRLARSLIDAFSPDGKVIRMGGDGFVIITPSVDLRERFSRALDAFSRIEETPADAVPHANVSLGAARVSAGVEPNQDALYLLADKALYTAKAQGSGAVVETRFDAHATQVCS